MKSKKPSYLTFDGAGYQWKSDIDYRAHPEQYCVGKGEQGVLICEPYKSEIGINWRFRTEVIAQESSSRIFAQFLQYLRHDEFVGADMARKYLQMGYTRARRYSNYKGGKKYDKTKDYEPLPRGTGDPNKAAAAAIFFDKWKEAENNPEYKKRKKEWKEKFG